MILLFSTAILCSTTFIPVIPRKVLVALLKPAVIASSKPLGDAAIISVTLGNSEPYNHLPSDVYDKNHP